jgi:hypothetical protein
MGNTITSLASTLTQAVDAVQKGIVETQEQLATGKATLNAAETGVVSRLTAQVSGYDSVVKNLTGAGSAIDVAQSALSSISTIMSQLKGLATQASSAGFASTDRDSLNLTFQNLTGQIEQLVTSASVNGANLINTDYGLQVTTGIDGTEASQTQIHATNVGDLVTALKELLITGLEITNQTFAATELTTPVSTLVGSAIGTLAGTVNNTTPAAPIVTFPDAGLKAGDSYVITINQSPAKVITLAVTSDMTDDELATAFAAYITAGTLTPFGNISGTITGLSGTATGGVLTITATGATSTTTTYTNPDSSQIQTITLPSISMAEGNSLTIGNLTFTAGPGPGTTAAGISPSAVSSAFVNYINNGVQPDSSIGTFTTTTTAVTQVQTITFRDLAIGDSLSAGGLTFTATAATTAAQLTTAFLAKIGNSAATSIYGGWGVSAKVAGLGTAVSAGGSTTSIAWSYSAAGGKITNLLTTGTTATGRASYTISGQSAVDIASTITKIGMNANTGTKITGGSLYGVSATVTSSNTFELTTTEPLTTGSTPGGIALISKTDNSTIRNILTFTNTDLLTGVANLFAGDSVTINGLTFTASQDTTPQQVLDAFKNVINDGDTGNLYGTFSNTDLDYDSLSGKVAQFTDYFTAIDLGNNVLAIDNQDDNTSTASLEISWNTQNAAISNANKATQIISAQIDTVSTAQASLAAASAGLDAQLKNATNIKNGMQKTVDAISNINPTALQAQLQQLNTQQSVDYYLVSQMNTAAAAILSIFR